MTDIGSDDLVKLRVITSMRVVNDDSNSVEENLASFGDVVPVAGSGGVVELCEITSEGPTDGSERAIDGSTSAGGRSVPASVPVTYAVVSGEGSDDVV